MRDFLKNYLTGLVLFAMCLLLVKFNTSVSAICGVLAMRELVIGLYKGVTYAMEEEV